MRTGLAVAAGLLAVSTVSGCAGGGYTVTATFDDAGDLQTRGSVQVADVRVGQIAGIHLTRDFKARVELRVNNSVRVPRDSVALLRTTSLLGEKFVELRAKGDPAKGPFLRDGDVVRETREAPEFELVAEQAVSVLGSVVASDVASLVDTGAAAFGDRGPELKQLIADLASISSTFASRSQQIGAIVDGLDRTAASLAAGADDLDGMLVNLAETTRLLAANRERAVNALVQLSRLAAVQNEVLTRYRSDIDRQIKEVDAILGIAASQSQEVGLVVDWLDRFVVGLPKVIPGDFTQVYLWAIPAEMDPRVGQP